MIFLAYLAVLIKITLIKCTTIPRLIQNLAEGKAPLRSLNLVPLNTIFTYFLYRNKMNFLRWFANIFGNVLIFAPPPCINEIRMVGGVLGSCCVA